MWKAAWETAGEDGKTRNNFRDGRSGTGSCSTLSTEKSVFSTGNPGFPFKKAASASTLERLLEYVQGVVQFRILGP